MKCPRCGKDDGNYEIWLVPAAFGDPPECYCSARDETVLYRLSLDAQIVNAVGVLHSTLAHTTWRKVKC